MDKNSVIDALEKIEFSALGNARIEALASVADVPGLSELVRLATDDSVTFGIKKIPDGPHSSPTHRPPWDSDYDWSNVLIQILGRMSRRELTGHAAQETVSAHLWECTAPQRKWAERVVLKDLRLNLGTKDVNRAIPGLCFEFSVPLAVDYKKASEKDLRGEWVAQYKIDGARCVAYLYGDGTGRVELRSRTGKEWGNFESVRGVLAGWNAGRTGPDLVLDGEMVALDESGRVSFNCIAQNMHAKQRAEVGWLQYMVFDCATRPQWEGREQFPTVYDGTYRARYAAACELVFAMHDDGVDRSRVVVVPQIGSPLSPTVADLVALNVRAVADGYEGAMVRKADSPLELKRSKKLLKIKAFSDSEARVVGVVEGNGKHAGRLGTLECETAEGVAFEIGSGFDDATRDELWADRASLIGRDVKYKFFEVSKDGVPRFPIFLGWRHPVDR